jgi:hypothetical protein
MAKQLCELCFVEMNSEDHTICTLCDVELARVYAQEDRAKDEKWSAKHKCRDCGAGLPRSRRFQCTGCLPDSVRQTEHEWELEESLDEWLLIGGAKAKNPERAPGNTTPKECNVCHVTKPRTEFPWNPRLKDGYFPDCKACRNAARRARHAAKRAEEQGRCA